MKLNMTNKASVQKRLLKVIAPYYLLVILSLVFSVISVFSSLYLPILIGKGIDLIITKGQVDFDGLLDILIKIGGLISSTFLSLFFTARINNKIIYSVAKDLRDQGFWHLQKLPVSYVDSSSQGDLITRLITDIEQVTDGLLLGFTQLFTGILTIIGTLFFMLGINGMITIVVVVITPISLFVASFIARHTYNMFQKQSEFRSQLASYINERIENQKIVKIFSEEENSIRKFQTINESLGKYSMRAIFYSSITMPATRFINGLVYSGVGIAGGFFAINGMISVGQLASFLSYSNQYTKPFNEISTVITELQNAFVSAERIFRFLDEEPEKEIVNPLAITDLDGTVEIKNIFFSYDKNKKFIQNFSLSVKQGERVAFVGQTGCGKTTIMNLLMGFYQLDGGDILFSDKSIGKISKESLRKNLGLVLQDTWIKNGTIAENIGFGKENATFEDIVSAAKKTYAHSFISRLPQGYETYISQDSELLSQGQKQLICISRVMLQLPSILILDEATSSIDTRTEIKVQKAFQEMMKGRTSFVVAHRLSTIIEADKIVVMKDGAIVEMGTHQELLVKKSAYYNLYNSQFAIS